MWSRFVKRLEALYKLIYTFVGVMLGYQPEPFTHIMRRKIWVLPGILIPLTIVCLAAVAVACYLFGRTQDPIWFILLGFGLFIDLLGRLGAFVAGHVYWGSGIKRAIDQFIR